MFYHHVFVFSLVSSVMAPVASRLWKKDNCAQFGPFLKADNDKNDQVCWCRISLHCCLRLPQESDVHHFIMSRCARRSGGVRCVQLSWACLWNGHLLGVTSRSTGCPSVCWPHTRLHTTAYTPACDLSVHCQCEPMGGAQTNSYHSSERSNTLTQTQTQNAPTCIHTTAHILRHTHNPQSSI